MGRGAAERAKRAELTGLDTDTQYKLPVRHTIQAYRTDTQYKLTLRHTIQYKGSPRVTQGVPKGAMKPPVRFDSKRSPPIETEPRPVLFRTTGSDGSGSYRFQIGGLLDEVPKLIQVPIGDFWTKYP